MSVKRIDLVRYFEEHGFYLLREGANHSIYTNGTKVIPIEGIGSSTVSLQTSSVIRQGLLPSSESKNQSSQRQLKR